jgi:CBS domain containing-hemolysin-like protein
MYTEISLLVILLVLSGFFSSAETALFSISKIKAKHLAKENGLTNMLIKKMKDDPHKLLSTILIGNNLVNIGASAFATAIAIGIFSNNVVSFVIVIMTFLILVFGEIIPKSFATHHNIFIARFVIVPIYWLSILFFPIVKFLNFIPHLTGKISKSPTVTEEDLMTILEVVEEGEINQEERALIHNIFEFDDTSASEIMTPRADMFVIDADEDLPMDEIIQSGYTRIPVIQGDIDHVIGILNTKDLLKYQVASVPSAKLDIAAIMRKPYFVPETKKLDKLLHQFKLRKHHIAIVVDEHGGVSGLITLEDVVEEIVGDISDETDKVDPHIVKLKSKEWLVLGKSDIDEVNKKLRMDLPDSKDYDTFSGYILDKTGRIPNENETIKIDGFTVIVKEMDGNRINAFIIKKN